MKPVEHFLPVSRELIIQISYSISKKQNRPSHLQRSWLWQMSSRSLELPTAACGHWKNESVQSVLPQTPEELQHHVEIMAFNLSGALKLNYLCLRGSGLKSHDLPNSDGRLWKPVFANELTKHFVTIMRRYLKIMTQFVEGTVRNMCKSSRYLDI